MDIHKIYRPFLSYFRKKRMKGFFNLFEVGLETIILDVGGNDFNCSLIDFDPAITFLNVESPKDNRNSRLWVVADCRLFPFKDQAFEIVYSNSFIEHLCPFENQIYFQKNVVE